MVRLEGKVTAVHLTTVDNVCGNPAFGAGTLMHRWSDTLEFAARPELEKVDVGVLIEQSIAALILRSDQYLPPHDPNLRGTTRWQTAQVDFEVLIGDTTKHTVIEWPITRQS